MIERGVYFIANDNIYDLTVAFLNSVRLFEPLIPICLIPYNENCQRITGLSNEYNFTIWEDNDVLARCDAIGKHFHGTACGQYRKLAIWSGHYEQFAYLDTDTVLLSSLNVVLGLLNDYDIVAAESDNPAIRKFVWKDSLPADAVEFDTRYAANTGILLSKCKILPLEICEQNVMLALKYAEHMELVCAEQPFLNYSIVASGRKYSSLSKIARDNNRKNIPQHVWAGGFDGDLLKLAHPSLLIHWAGMWQNQEHLQNPVWRYFRYLRDDYQ